jgi:hypothetical protein
MTANPPAQPERPTQCPHPLATELEVFYRALPRWLAEGEAGRYAVVKGTEICGTWDSFRDGLQYGYERFGGGPFLTQKIDERYLASLAQWFGPLPDAEGEAA